ncbi:hypothetical protein D3C80_2202100 [compost metagenome]
MDTPEEKQWREGKLPAVLGKARAHPEWSSLNPGAELEQAERQGWVASLAKGLEP